MSTLFMDSKWTNEIASSSKNWRCINQLIYLESMNTICFDTKITIDWRKRSLFEHLQLSISPTNTVFKMTIPSSIVVFNPKSRPDEFRLHSITFWREKSPPNLPLQIVKSWNVKISINFDTLKRRVTDFIAYSCIQLIWLGIFFIKLNLTITLKIRSLHDQVLF